ncbi:2-phosphosulfolactate phosphatase XcbC [Methylomonas sp. MgM2]
MAKYDALDHRFGELALEIGGRLQHGPSERLIATAFRQELEAQLPLFDALSRVDLAHSLVMMENGIIPKPDSYGLLKWLIRLSSWPDDFRPDPVCGDLYTNREAWLRRQTESAKWLGAGRARREAITTAFVIKQRELLLQLNDALTAMIRNLLDRAEQSRQDPMPDYTYWLSAQPTSFGHYLLGFAYPVLRDMQRLQALFARLNLSPAGCGSSNGSRLPQARTRLAELLGFDGVVSHARDAMWQADLPIETVAMLTIILINLDRLAEDLQIFATEEFGLISLDDGHARASKIMPQKKNPFALAHIRGLANNLIGTLSGTAAMGRTATGQVDNRLSLYGSLPELINRVSGAVELMAEVVSTMDFDREQARRRLEHSFAAATDLAEVIVLETGLSFREAHKLVGELVSRHLQEGGFNNLSTAEIAECADALGKTIALSDCALQQALDPEAALAARRDIGGAAPEAMSHMLSECRQTLRLEEQWRNDRQQRLDAAQVRLEHTVQAYLASEIES